MPVVFRAMMADGDAPQLGSTAVSLGIRLPPDPHADLVVDENGNVGPGTGGMSVAPEWRLLPVHRIPRRLRSKYPRAAGRSDVKLWRMGDGPFVAGPVAARLLLRPDPKAQQRHGFVEPDARMASVDYQQALADTRDHWQMDED
jgi:hypothetical protein